MVNEIGLSSFTAVQTDDGLYILPDRWPEIMTLATSPDAEMSQAARLALASTLEVGDGLQGGISTPSVSSEMLEYILRSVSQQSRADLRGPVLAILSEGIRVYNPRRWRREGSDA